MQFRLTAKILLVFIFHLVLLQPRSQGQERMGSFMAFSWRLGLSAGLNTYVCESSDGYLWIATGIGLIKFDGRNYHSIVAGPGSIPDNLITSIASAANGKSVWIGTLRHGVARYDTESKKFRSYSKLWNFESHTQSVNKILCFENGQVWLGTGTLGLGLFDPEKDTFQFYYPYPMIIYNNEPSQSFDITDMVQDPKDQSKIWVLCNNGIYLFDTNECEFHSYLPAGKTQYALISVDHDRKGGLWIGTWGNSMFHFDINSRKLTQLKNLSCDLQLDEGMLALDVMHMNDSTVLWSCALSGLFCYNPKTRSFRNLSPTGAIPTENGEPIEFNAISRTKNAGIFIGSKGYLFQYHPYLMRLGKTIVPAPKNPFDEIYTGKGVWDSLTKSYLIPAAGPVALLSITKDKLTPASISLDAKGLKELCQLQDGRILALGFEGKVHIYDSEKRKLSPAILQITPDYFGLEIRVDAKGLLWLLTRRNLFRIDSRNVSTIDSFSFLSFHPKVDRPFSTLYLYHLETDSKGNAWVGSNQGIWMAKPGEKQFTLFHPKNGKGEWLKDRLIKSMAIDPKDRLWVGYNGDGIDIFDTKELKPINWPQSSNLQTWQVNDLVATASGNILAPTTEGLLAVNSSSLDWQILGTEDGLNKQFMDRSIWVAPDGMIFINHGTRLNAFPESALQIQHKKLKINIIRVTVNNVEQEPVMFEKAESYLELPYYSNNISLSFAAMHWLYPFKTSYSYRLSTERDSGHWKNISEPTVQLNALQSGNYVIELKATGASSVPSLNKKLFISIMPPIWERSWFYLLISLILILAFYSLYRFRVSQLYQQLLVRDTISRNLHDDIGSSLSNIQILTELTRQNLANKEKAKSFLSRAAEDISRISEALSEIIWNVNPKYDDLQYLFARMKRHAAESFEGKGIQYELLIPEESPKFTMSMEQRRDFYLIYKECIHNLIKYSGTGFAQVHVSLEHKKVSLEVRDQGVGFVKEEVVMGTGLQSMNARAQKWKGKLLIKSAPGSGTTISLTMLV